MQVCIEGIFLDLLLVLLWLSFQSLLNAFGYSALSPVLFGSMMDLFVMVTRTIVAAKYLARQPWEHFGSFATLHVA